MLPYLRRMESDANFGDRPYHGADGPMPVLRLERDQWGPADNALAEAAAGLGYGWCDDHNGPEGTGVSPYGITAREGFGRVTTNDGYLERARERPNLRVLGGATVDKVLFDGVRAAGVRVRIAGEWVEVRAQGVVLCAGAIHSPAILLRSVSGPSCPSPTSRSARACRSTRSRCSGSTGARRCSPRWTPARRTAASATPPAWRGRARTT